MNKKKIKYIVWIFLGVLSIAALIGITYLLNPKYVEEKAFNLFYPPVEVNEKYKNKIVVEVPEVYELMQIASSLTKSFQNDPNLIRSNSHYYKDLKIHFRDFENHELVLKLNEYYKINAYGSSQHAIRANSLNYFIAEDNTLSLNKFPIPLSNNYKEKTFLIAEHLDLIEDFAQESHFIDFYKNHLPCYTKLISNYHDLCDFQGMKSWLEDKFTSKYQSYRIIFSPLTDGFHSTMRSKRMNQTLMFVSAPREEIDGLSAREFELASSRSSRVVFTEIDHNYVNPLTDQYLEELDIAMDDYKSWNDQKNSLYPTKYKTFNEYMTWGVFNLYALDTYSEENINTIIKGPTDLITEKRKFIQFREFNKELIRLYKSKNKPQIKALYEPIFNWMKNESESNHTKE